MEHSEMIELLGAYAIDAVDGEEYQEISDHIALCESCAQEVASHREVAALLAPNAPHAPQDVWDSIAKVIEGERPTTELKVNELHLAHKPVSQPKAAEPHRLVSVPRRLRHTYVVGSLVAAAVIGILGIDVARLQGQVASLHGVIGGENLSSVATSVLASPSTSQYEIRSASGQELATVAISPNGSAYVIPRRLPTLGSGQTYQLWTVSQGGVVSLGVLGEKPQICWFRYQSTMKKLMVNVEPTGGSTLPTSQVLGSVTL